MLRILITGVNGFIGSHIADRMISEGHDVVGLVRQRSDLSLIKDKKITLKYGDVTDEASLTEAVKQIDIVIHNAGLASDWGELNLFMKINCGGTQNLARVAERAGVKRMVLMSSTAIHGFGSSSPMNEDSAINTQGFFYSISKWEAEKWLFEFGKKSMMEVTATRPGNVFGPRDHTFIEKYLDVLVKGQGGYVNGGKSKTCPVYIGNLTKAVAIAATHPKAPGQAFIITDGLDITWRQFTERLTDEMNIKRPHLSIPFSVGNLLAIIMEKSYQLVGSKNSPILTSYRMHNGGKDYWFSIDKATNLLGYSPETDLDSAVTETVKWYKNKKGIQ